MSTGQGPSHEPRGLIVAPYRLARQSVNVAEARWLHAAVQSGGVAYGDGPGAARRHALALHDRLLVRYLAAQESGWALGMWGAVVLATGYNALWQARGDTHTPGCGSPWAPDGTCTGCRVLRRLDVDAYTQFRDITGDRDPVTGQAGQSVLWCDEHGYLRRTQWTTDKTCRASGSPLHEVNMMRLSVPC